jgi:poly-beta-hydroxyalkanoate depolymerase
MLDRTATEFSHVKPADTAYVPGGLRDFFLYRDLGVAEATHGKVIAHLVDGDVDKANRIQVFYDDICAIGQTGVGHYGVFSGRKWNPQIYPRVREMIHANQS